MVKGLDLSFSRTTAAWFMARKSEGFEVVCQCLHTGGDVQALIPTAKENLLNAHSVGFKLSGYLNASPWKPGDVVVAEAKGVAGDAWDLIPVLFVDIEIDGLTEDRIRATVEAAEATGKAVALYSARWFWEGHLGNAQWPWLLDYQLWAADYDDDPDVGTATLFGPWTKAHHKQFSNTETVEGVDIDRDTFDLSLWEGEMPTQQEWDAFKTAVGDSDTALDTFIKNVKAEAEERDKALTTYANNIADALGALAATVKESGDPALVAKVEAIEQRLADIGRAASG